MKYREDDLDIILERQHESLQDLRKLQITFVSLSQQTDFASLKEHLAQGVGFRLGIITRAIENTFLTLDLRATQPISDSENNDLQINVHAFLINLVGIFDNLAWAFALRHKIEDLLENPVKIDFFKSSFHKFLPTPLKEHLQKKTMADWHKDYLKNYRDALAHRIPPRVPRITVDRKDSRAYESLDQARWSKIIEHKFEEAENIRNQQKPYERPGFFMIHSFHQSTKSDPIMVHAQMIADSITLREFAHIFEAHWDKCASKSV